MAVERQNRERGRRIQSRTDRTVRPERTYRRTEWGGTAYRRGKREEPVRPGEKRRLWQMTVSAVILLLVVGCKLAMPGVMETYRQQILTLLGEDTDFVAAFSSVGRVVSPGGAVGEAISDAYTAVFGPQEVSQEKKKEDTSAEDSDQPEQQEEASQPDQQEEPATPAESKTEPADQPPADGEKEPIVYTAENTPDNVCLTQQVLGFSFADPVEGTISDPFGYRTHPIQGDVLFHYGVDIAADSGTIIRSFADGTVTAVGESSELGKYVTVVHSGDYTTLYAHCSRVTASSGQQVSLGDPIAEVGETGQTTGPHLHFELHHDKLYLNPIYYVVH